MEEDCEQRAAFCSRRAVPPVEDLHAERGERLSQQPDLSEALISAWRTRFIA